MREYLLNDRRILDTRNDFQRPAATFAGLDVDAKDAFQTLRQLIATCGVTVPGAAGCREPRAAGTICIRYSSVRAAYVDDQPTRFRGTAVVRNANRSVHRRIMVVTIRTSGLFGIEIEGCVRCGGKLKIIASIEEPLVIAKILSHLQRTAPQQYPTELPLGARAPPVQSSLL
jgi:hypothetical protein